MRLTTFDEFVELAKRGTFVPVCKEIMADLLTPVSAFLKIAEHSDYAFLLESVEGGEHVGRYSFLGKDPFLVLRARRRTPSIERAGVTTESAEAVHPHAAQADGRLPVAVRAGAAALHRRRRRLPRLRRGAWFEPVPTAATLDGPAAGADHGRLHALRHGARVRSRAAPAAHHRQRAHHRRRGPRVAVSVRLREDRVPREGAGTQRCRLRARREAGAARRARRT